jgi:guanylate kinase
MKNLDPRTKIAEEELYRDNPNWMSVDLDAIKRTALTKYNLQGCELFLLCGVSTAGKNTLLAALQQRNPGIKLIPRATSRPPRPGEKDGVDYFFSMENVVVWSEFGGNKYAITEQVIERLSQVKQGVMIQGLLYSFVLQQILSPIGVRVHTLYVVPAEINKGVAASLAVIRKRLFTRHPDVAHLRIDSIERELGFVFKHITALKNLGVSFIENPPHRNQLHPQAVSQMEKVFE